ncbi:alpha-glucosidase II [Scheffersomyces amazonensis]|uniref:alpha-glucosidase II n=1 Tax=Scheffersomyces amazonensis TaxID=1078765 RepID=UPI00315CFDC5
MLRHKMEHYSLDRHIDSDTRFSRGMWELKHGVKIKWATEVVKSEIQDGNSIYNVASTSKIYSRGDTLNVPTITIKLTSPSEGIIGFEAYHHISTYKNSKEPEIKLNKDSYSPKVVNDDDFSNLNAGDGAVAKLEKNPFSVEFLGEDKLLTKLGRNSLGWVEDRRYLNVNSQAEKAVTYMTFQLHLSVGEKLFGLGERFGPFLKNGQRVQMWNEDGGTSSEWTYKNIPFYISSRGYGIYVDSVSNVIFELQSERTNRVNIAVPGEGVRFYIIKGPDPKTILNRFTQLTGRPSLPPAWTFGLWLTTSFTTNYDIDTVSSFLDGMKERDIPLSTFHFDCFWMKGFQWCDFEFDPEYFPNATKMLKQLKEKYNIKICVWINSYIGQESKLFKEADENHYLIRYKSTVNGGGSYQTDLWQAGMGIVDFTNPNAVRWYQDKLASLIDIGVDCFKTDFGERIPVKDIEYYDGSDPIAMHNYYTLLYNKCVFEILEKKLGVHKACLFARSATVGGQKYPVHWGGDCESSFEAMADSLRGGLSLTLCGYGYWSHDIGGFEGQPLPSVYKRWCAFGLLSSHSRLHGSGSYRVPWNFDDESSVVLAKFTKLKLSLMPYIYRFAIDAHNSGIPVMRAFLLEFPSDPNAIVVDTEYMLGDSLLVAPVFNAEGDIEYYLPKGEWYGLLDGKVRSSTGEWFNEIHDFKSLPLLVKSNSIIVTSGPNAKNDDPVYDWNNQFMINIFNVAEIETKIPNSKGEFTTFIKSKDVDGTITVEVKGSSNYYIKLLNKKDVTINGNAKLYQLDEFGNSIFEVKGSSTSFTYK